MYPQYIINNNNNNYTTTTTLKMYPPTHVSIAMLSIIMCPQFKYTLSTKLLHPPHASAPINSVGLINTCPCRSNMHAVSFVR